LVDAFSHGRLARRAKRFPQDKLLPPALAHLDGFHADVIEEVEKAVSSNDLVVVGMAQNPFVKRARKALEKGGHTFTYLEYGSYLGDWKKRLAIKLWAGWPTFPMVFVKGKLLGGAVDTEKAVADGSIKTYLE
jgi:monothiol glutaredoxin